MGINFISNKTIDEERILSELDKTLKINKM